MKPEVVKLAYQLILGREPENDAVIEEKAAALNSLDELRRDLVNSEEFRSTVAGSFSVCLSGYEPALPIDTLATIAPGTLEVLEDAWTFPKKGDRSNTFVALKRIS